MVAGGDLKISDQNNWGGGRGGDLSKKLNLGGGGAKFKVGPKILGGGL